MTDPALRARHDATTTPMINSSAVAATINVDNATTSGEIPRFDACA